MKNNKGFTLAEMLIVVAIIAVLVSVAIPVFANKLEAAKEAVDVSNMRTAYGIGATMMMTGELDEETVYYFNGASLIAEPPGEGCGKGTTREGSKVEYLDYNAATDVKGLFLIAYVEDGEIRIEWQ